MKLPYIIKDQNGAVTLPITILLMLLISVIVVTITEVSNTGTEKALDNQLSTQANYAAESGVNDAIRVLKSGAVTYLPPNPTDCNSFIDTYLPGKNALSTSPYIAYTCLIVTAQPPNLTLDVKQPQAQQVRIEPAQITNHITVTWSAPDEYGSLEDCVQANLQFVNQDQWTCPVGVLRMDYYQTNGSPVTAQNLAEDTDTFFFVPVMNGGVTGSTKTIQFVGNDGEPEIIPVTCTNEPPNTTCSITLNAPNVNDDFNGYASINTIYRESDVTISGGPVTFVNSQLSIDSTGDDQGVLKRVQARVQLSSNPPGSAPSAALYVGTSLCKQYTVGPEIANDPNSYIDDAYPGLQSDANGLGTPQSNPLCGEAYKPVIYLYPTQPEDVNVKLYYPSGFSATTPTYDPTTGWNVLANPNGNLVNLSDGKTYPYLYWEGNKLDFNFDMTKGFVVPGNQTASFLSQELPKIGLDKKETAAFLQYWVPKMEHNKYSLIHFAGKDYTNLAKLQITPKPDSLLRVFMAEEPLARPVPVTPQTFPVFHRTGFTAVEWGGTILGQQ